MIEFTDRPGEARHFVHKRLFGAAKGFFGGGVIGATRGFLSENGGSRRRAPSRSFRRPTRTAPARRRPQARRVVPVPGFRGRIERALPGGRTGLMVPAAAPSGGCPQGFHPNKSDYMTKAGFVAEGTKCVRNRRRNLSNGRANTRSLRRMAAWDKQERKLGKTLKAIARGR